MWTLKFIDSMGDKNTAVAPDCANFDSNGWYIFAFERAKIVSALVRSHNLLYSRCRGQF